LELENGTLALALSHGSRELVDGFSCMKAVG